MTGPTTRSTRDLVLDGLLRSAPLSVFAYDADGVCFFSEGAALLDMGIRPGELVGKRVADVRDEQGAPLVEDIDDLAFTRRKLAEHSKSFRRAAESPRYICNVLHL